MAQIESKFYYYYLVYDDDAKPWNVKSIASLTTVFISLMDICCARLRPVMSLQMQKSLPTLNRWLLIGINRSQLRKLLFLFVYTQQTTTLMFYWLNYRLKLPSRSRETFVKQTSYIIICIPSVSCLRCTHVRLINGFLMDVVTQVDECI